MKLIRPKVEILDRLDERAVIGRIATVARTCYKSENMRTADKDYALVKRLIDSKHDAMLEFVDVTVKFTTDRAIANELVRHRLASYAQESTRYCNYGKDKFGNELTFIIPVYTTDEELETIVQEGLQNAENCYLDLVKKGWPAEYARFILPLCTKTEINMKANLREWRHFFKLRCDKHAHPEKRFLALNLLKQMYDKLPTIFEDLYNQYYGNNRQTN